MSEFQTFAADDSELRQLHAFVARRCEQLALGRSVMLRLQLIVEELFTNTTSHGQAGPSSVSVRTWISRH